MTLTELLDKLQITDEDLRQLGTDLVNSIRSRIENNNVPGANLAQSTIQDKKRRNSPFPEYKLYDTGEMKDDLTFEIKSSSVMVGQTEKKHALKKRTTSRRWKKGAKNRRIKISNLAMIHNEGLGQKKRNYLHLYNEPLSEEKLIFINWLDSIFKI